MNNKDTDQNKEFSKEFLTNDFSMTDMSDGMGTSLVLQDGKLYKKTWVDSEVVKDLLARAAYERSVEKDEKHRGGALGRQMYSLPLHVGNWILEKHKLEDVQHDPASRKIFLRAIERDIIPGLGPISAFKWTNGSLT